MGLQRQVVLNVVRVTFATLRGLGAVTILAYVAQQYTPIFWGKRLYLLYLF